MDAKDETKKYLQLLAKECGIDEITDPDYMVSAEEALDAAIRYVQLSNQSKQVPSEQLLKDFGCWLVDNKWDNKMLRTHMIKHVRTFIKSHLSEQPKESKASDNIEPHYNIEWDNEQYICYSSEFGKYACYGIAITPEGALNDFLNNARDFREYLEQQEISQEAKQRAANYMRLKDAHLDE